VRVLLQLSWMGFIARCGLSLRLAMRRTAHRDGLVEWA
jgi:hypothetical protein